MMFRASLTAAITCVSLCAVLAFQNPVGVTSPTATNSSIPASALAMMPSSQTNDVLYIKSGVASFKMVPKGDTLPAGRLEFSFSGTVLITGLSPGSYLQTFGNVRKEYEDKGHAKQVFFGRGKLLIVGRFRNCEWFGRDLDLKFKGSAFFRIIAEFDDKLDTGSFWFEGERGRSPLQTNLIPIEVPKPRGGPMEAITREEFEALKRKNKGG
jgi:hypothetical protein